MNAQHSEIKIQFPLNQFFKQLFFSPLSRVIINPKRFHYLYMVDLLECAWTKDYIQTLEQCWQQDCDQNTLEANNEGTRQNIDLLDFDDRDIDRGEVDSWF